MIKCNNKYCFDFTDLQANHCRHFANTHIKNCIVRKLFEKEISGAGVSSECNTVLASCDADGNGGPKNFGVAMYKGGHKAGNKYFQFLEFIARIENGQNPIIVAKNYVVISKDHYKKLVDG